jgi:ParB-like chromosome segregation protein Spo0J
MSEEQMARKVIAENYNRRHLTDQQKMIITADLVKQGMITRENAEKLLDVSGRTLSKAIRVAGAPDEVKSLVESNKVSIGKATNFLDGKISQEEMLADGRKEGKTGEGRGRPIGNAKLNKFYKCLKQVHESLSDEVPDVVFRNWTGDPEQEMQLYEVAEKLNNLVERIEDVKKPKAVGT